MNRRKARENAFLVLFEAGFHRQGSAAGIYKSSTEEGRLEPDPFTEELVQGVNARLAEIDDVISRHLKQWKKERMSRVSLAVLRLSVYEILYSEISDRIAANEAVELCKKYDTEDGPAFVNGILGSIIRGKA